MISRTIAGLSLMLACLLIAGIFYASMPKAEFEIDNLQVSPWYSIAGENVTATVDIVNCGNDEGSQNIVLFIDDEPRFNWTVKLQPNERTIESITFPCYDIGEHWVKVGDFQRSFNVEPMYFKGAYLIYNVTGEYRLTPFNGTVRMDITEVTEDSYTVVTTSDTPAAVEPSTVTRPLPTPNSDFSEGYGQLIGEELILTVFGYERASHYLIANETTIMNSYVAQGTNLAYAVKMEQPALIINLELSETNINWVKYR